MDHKPSDDVCLLPVGLSNSYVIYHNVSWGVGTDPGSENKKTHNKRWEKTRALVSMGHLRLTDRDCISSKCHLSKCPFCTGQTTQQTKLVGGDGRPSRRWVCVERVWTYQRYIRHSAVVFVIC